MAETAKERLVAWYEDQRKNHGLVDIKFTLGDTSKANVENVCADILRVIDAKNRGDCQRIATSCNV